MFLQQLAAHIIRPRTLRQNEKVRLPIGGGIIGAGAEITWPPAVWLAGSICAASRGYSRPTQSAVPRPWLKPDWRLSGIAPEKLPPLC
jgi:hypothetical protein